MLNFDVGLIDFEIATGEDDLWYDDINPSIGISADVLKLLNESLIKAEFLETFGNVVGIGFGIYAEFLDGGVEMLPMLYIVAQW